MQIEYREHPEYPSLRTFRCEPLRADLSPASCARNQQTEKFLTCRASPIGRAHSQQCGPQAAAIDETGKVFRPVQPARPCVRCGVAALRLIRQELCVSCYNRQLELRRGRNAKGARPVIVAKRLHPARCLVHRDGNAELLDLEFCSGREEAAAIVKRRWPTAHVADYEQLSDRLAPRARSPKRRTTHPFSIRTALPE
ncbi:hypothetical protein C7402_11980 [Paraburkholderia unamae]|uniref:Uncharacterized protein n=1 Tax=Paraburkholderia unamae TaxID=219649 RepID=A0ABX5KEY3_9BURK|nr:hypothetical protein C7402_11980 [Paraburkholderia unamae]